VEKLRRSGGYTLSSIHDLAWMRVVVTGGRAAQDQMAERIQDVFMDGVRAPRIIDRRLKPVQGYRAVHVIVYPDGYPIEVQVRTEWQHMWAEWFERFADQYGRGIRYGEPPIRGGEGAGEIVEMMIRMADQIAQAEESEGKLPPTAAFLALATAVLEWLEARRREA
jgi:ppGpp synthetase/RelA/SpoT-type nucleotidyltranferase